MAIDARDVVKAGIRERKGCLQRLANLDELIMLAMAGDQAGLDRLAIHTGFVVGYSTPDGGFEFREKATAYRQTGGADPSPAAFGTLRIPRRASVA